MNNVSNGLSRENATRADLAEYLEEIARRLEQGDQVDLARESAAHPEYAAHLQELWPALQVLVSLGHQPNGGASSEAAEQIRQLGEFRILRELGRGGMGIVYEAEQLSLGRRVALKVLPFAGVLDERQLQRFKHEASAAAMLKHPHIVSIYSIGCERGVHFYAMELIDGPTLADVIEARRSQQGKFGSRKSEVGSKEADGAPNSSVPNSEFRIPNFPDTSPVLQAALSTVNSTSEKERFRRIAELGIQATEALEHAHERGIVHRDIKPSNLMVDAGGQLWITDFGLAHIEANPNLTLTGDLVGTLRYMSAEQAAGRPTMIDHRTDIYSLGATMYELATDRPVVQAQDRAAILREIAEKDPASPRKYTPSMPADLETILLKCLAKEPSARYESAQALAEDLRRFLESKPVLARQPTIADQLKKWGRRHPDIVRVCAVSAALLLATILGSAFYLQRQQTRGAMYATKLLTLESIRAAERKSMPARSWRDDATALIAEARALGPPEPIRDIAVSFLSGLDAHVVRETTELGATRLMFDPSGQQLLMGDVSNGEKSTSSLPSQRWALGSQAPLALRATADGPVGFTKSGRPIEISTLDPDRGAGLRVLDLVDGHVLAELSPPAGITLVLRDEEDETSPLAMTPDGTRIAACGKNESNEKFVVIWDAETKAVLHTFAYLPSALALSPDGELLVAGTGNGGITIWSLTTGKPSEMATTQRDAIRCLAFARDRWSWNDAQRERPGFGWLLAAGDDASQLTIWDVAATGARRVIDAGEYGVFSLAFSPDATTIATAGRYRTRLWDVATGRVLLVLDGGDFIDGLAFSPNGEMIATANQQQFGPGCVRVWKLDPHRGINELRGLSGQITKLAFSRDGAHVAALDQNWQVAVWETLTGRLLHVWQAPKGLVTPDNAAIAFHPSKRLIAYSAGLHARLWDFDTGQERDRWLLTPGAEDFLTFDADGRLISWRYEVLQKNQLPFGKGDWDLNPRLHRVRELCPGGIVQELSDLKPFNPSIAGVSVHPDGDWLVRELNTGNKLRPRRIQFLDRNGKELKMPFDEPNLSGYLIDASGEIIAFSQPDERYARSIEIRSGRELGALTPRPWQLGRRGDYWVSNIEESGRPPLLKLCGAGATEPLVACTREEEHHFRFDRTGRWLAIGNNDGSVSLWDLPAVDSALTRLGLSWHE